MPLRITNRASAMLKELLDKHEHEPDQVIRLVSDAQGEGLILDRKSESDRAIRHSGATVLILDSSVNGRFSDLTLDVEESPKGNSWFLANRS